MREELPFLWRDRCITEAVPSSPLYRITNCKPPTITSSNSSPWKVLDEGGNILRNSRQPRRLQLGTWVLLCTSRIRSRRASACPRGKWRSVCGVNSRCRYTRKEFSLSAKPRSYPRRRDGNLRTFWRAAISRVIMAPTSWRKTSRMVAVSNTSPISNLSIIGRLHLLPLNSAVY